MTPIGEIHVAEMGGDVVYTSLTLRLSGAADLPHAADLGPIRDGTTRVVEHATGPRAADDVFWKYVTAGGGGLRFVQVGLPIDDSSPVSPR